MNGKKLILRKKPKISVQTHKETNYSDDIEVKHLYRRLNLILNHSTEIEKKLDSIESRKVGNIHNKLAMTTPIIERKNMYASTPLQNNLRTTAVDTNGFHTPKQGDFRDIQEVDSLGTERNRSDSSNSEVLRMILEEIATLKKEIANFSSTQDRLKIELEILCKNSAK